MATFKSYPPVLAGTTPPFCKTATANGTSYVLEVPFTMNKMTSRSEIGGVKLRIRAADTDLEIGRLNATNYTINSNGTSNAEFDLTPIAASIIIGKYYKIQLAYVDVMDANNIGYYSTVSIVKCTAYPSVGIAHLSTVSENPDYGTYIGEYANINDPSEKCYTYKWTLYDNDDNVLLTTSWLLHNANEDRSTYASNDQYDISYAFEPNIKYKIQYSVTTNNGLIVHGPKYLILGETALKPELKADLVAKLNYDDGFVSLALEPWRLRRQEMLTVTYTGSFIISRASSVDNFKFWTKLTSFTLTGTLPQGVIFKDFTVEHGQTYRYALQQFNNHDVYSQRVCTEDIKVVFEDMFLYDGDRQLKVRFNPKVTSFKTVLQDTKKNTLGSKYPFFFRNGNVGYKEFPISGLISYLEDENEYFMTRAGDLHMPIDWEDTTDILDDNLAYERTFKLNVMAWLEDGNIKLFRSPGEGNYLVRLTNVQLTPNDSLSRMIHTFTCTADEIADCTTANLVKYNFLNSELNVPLLPLKYTIIFDDMIEEILSTVINSTDPQKLANATTAQVNKALEQFRTTDLLSGNACVELEFENCGTRSTSYTNKTWFTFNKERYFINNGSYHQVYEEPGFELYVTNPYRHMPGQVACTVLAAPTTGFDSIANLETMTTIATPPYLSYNYIDSLNNTKYQLNHIDRITAIANDSYTQLTSLAQPETAWSYYLINGSYGYYEVLGGLTTTEMNELILDINSRNEYSEEYKTTLTTELQQVCQAMSSWTPGTNVGRAFAISYDLRQIINKKKITRSAWKNGYYFEDKSTSMVYELRTDGWTFIALAELPTVEITITDPRTHKSTLEVVTLTSNQICINDTVYTITGSASQDLPVPANVFQMRWGPRVNLTVLYSQLIVTYNAELENKNLQILWKKYNQSLMQETANKLRLHTITNNPNNMFYSHAMNQRMNAQVLVNKVPDKEYDEMSYFIWNTSTLRFERLTRADRAAFAGDLVWAPWDGVSPKPEAWMEDYNVDWMDVNMCKTQFYTALDAAILE